MRRVLNSSVLLFKSVQFFPNIVVAKSTAILPIMQWFQRTLPVLGRSVLILQHLVQPLLTHRGQHPNRPLELRGAIALCQSLQSLFLVLSGPLIDLLVELLHELAVLML